LLNGEVRVDDMVENGTAYDRATIDLGNAKKVVLPDNAVVRRSGQTGKLQLFIARTLSFAGHPPKAMTVRGARKNMGCATHGEGASLVIATFGEWDSHIEGGAYMKIVALVPQVVEVEQRKGLSGPESAGQGKNGESSAIPKDAPDEYWYSSTSPADGWSTVASVPDPDRTASK
jgi:hypothetical protein